MAAYLVLLLENDLGRLLIQILHCALMYSSISSVSGLSVMVPPYTRALRPLPRLPRLVLLALRPFPEFLCGSGSPDDLALVRHDIGQVREWRSRGIEDGPGSAGSGGRLQITGRRGLSAEVSRWGLEQYESTTVTTCATE